MEKECMFSWKQHMFSCLSETNEFTSSQISLQMSHWNFFCFFLVFMSFKNGDRYTEANEGKLHLRLNLSNHTTHNMTTILKTVIYHFLWDQRSQKLLHTKTRWVSRTKCWQSVYQTFWMGTYNLLLISALQRKVWLRETNMSSSLGSRPISVGQAGSEWVRQKFLWFYNFKSVHN